MEGLNQEIERLDLDSAAIHAGRGNRLDQVSSLRGETPDGSKALLLDDHQHPQPHHSSRRSVNTQTPVGEIESGFFAHLSSDESSNSPGDEEKLLAVLEEEGGSEDPRRSFTRIVGSAEASPRINKFMAQIPPEGCERVKLNPSEDLCRSPVKLKPVFVCGFRPSLGSAFRPTTTAALRRQSLERADGDSTEAKPVVAEVVESGEDSVPVDGEGSDVVAAKDSSGEVQAADAVQGGLKQ